MQHSVHYYDTDRDLPELNTTMIFDLISWAEFDDQSFANDEKFVGWGLWKQGFWSQVDDLEKARGAVWVEDPHNSACSTSYCMAGQAANQAGYRMLYDDGHADQCVPQRQTRVTEKGFPVWEDIPNASREMVSTVGASTLGITSSEANCFFEGDNSIDDLRRYANTFCFARNLPLLFPNDRIWEDLETDEYRIESTRVLA